MSTPLGYGMQSNIGRLTSAPALPAGWHKEGPGLWKHENGEESRINPASLQTNNNFSMLVSETSSESGKYTQGNFTPAGGDRRPGVVYGEQETASATAVPTAAPPPPPLTSLPPAWQEVWDPTSQHVYYYNHETKMSSWERPASSQENLSQAPPPPPPTVAALTGSSRAEPVAKEAFVPNLSASEPDQVHAIGDVVNVEGLQARPEYNGYNAIVESFDPSKDRYMVGADGTNPCLMRRPFMLPINIPRHVRSRAA